MANNFASDSRCLALWRFENGALTTDSKGGHTLTPSASAPTADTANYQEGAASANFAASSSQYFAIADGSLVAGFPCKSGDTVKKGTVCAWARPTSYAGQQTIYCKYDYTGRLGSIDIRTDYGSGYQILWVYDGRTYSTHNTSKAPVVNVWHHISVRFDGVNKTLSVRIWDGTNVANYDFTPANVMQVDNCEANIGCLSGTHSNYWNGKIDEVVVFNDLLSDDEVDQIRQGTFGIVDVDVEPDGIASAEAFGGLAVVPGTVALSPSGIVSTEAFGSATIQPGQVEIEPSGIASAEAFGSATIQPGQVEIEPSGIASAEAFGAPTISLMGAGIQTVSPQGIAPDGGFGLPAVAVGEVTISIENGITSQEAFGVPKVIQRLMPVGIASGEAFGSIGVQFEQFVYPVGIVSQQGVGVPVVYRGLRFIRLSGIPSAEVVSSKRLRVVRGAIPVFDDVILFAEDVMELSIFT